MIRRWRTDLLLGMGLALVGVLTRELEVTR